MELDNPQVIIVKYRLLEHLVELRSGCCLTGPDKVDLELERFLGLFHLIRRSSEGASVIRNGICFKVYGSFTVH